MKIRDLLSESRTGSLQDDVADAMPAAFVFPTLQNTDPYSQYRFGLAVATARRLNDPDPYGIVKGREDFAPTSAWGENLVVVTYEQGEDARTLELAAKLMGVSKRQISTTKSQESSDVNVQSPTKPVK
jgi:hypothetical protein